jgi:hypothetical protein
MQAVVTTHLFGDEEFSGHRTNVTTVTSSDGHPTSTVSVYVNGKRFDNFGTAGDRWFEYPTPQSFSFLGITQLADLAAPDGPVTVVGHTSTAGTPSTEYRISMPETATSGTTEPGSVGRRATTMHVAPSVLSVWIGDDGRVVRTDLTVRFTSSDSRPTTVRTVATLSDFGEPVHIEAPPNVTVLPSPPR